MVLAEVGGQPVYAEAVSTRWRNGPSGAWRFCLREPPLLLCDFGIESRPPAQALHPAACWDTEGPDAQAEPDR